MATKVTVHLTLFASLRDQAGLDQVSMSVEQSTVGKLYTAVAAQYQMELPERFVRFAANDQFVDADYEIQEGDRLVFLPPVSGG